MTSAELIAVLQRLDPTGLRDVIIAHEDYGYATAGGALGTCDEEGQLGDDKEDCVIIRTNF